MKLLLTLFALASPAAAQLVSEDFEVGNTHDWGVEFGPAAPHEAMGGNPDGRMLVTVQSSMSNLPAAMIVPAAAGHPWAGDFRAMAVASFTYDRQVEVGSSNFGTMPFLVLGNDGGTPTDFADDAWVFVPTGDLFQFGMFPWETFSTPIPSGEPALPSGWDAAALPNSTLAGFTGDDIWNAVIVDVDYVGISMARPFNGGPWFGAHMISFDNLALVGAVMIGNNYCSPAQLNSTGMPAMISASGTPLTSANNLTLEATQLPSNAFGFFLTSQMQGLTQNPGGSAGDLCLGGAIGRYVGAGQIQNSGAMGAFSLALDLTQTPTPNGLVPVMAGDTWNFQAWFRDSVAGMATSNFTDGLEVTFN